MADTNENDPIAKAVADAKAKAEENAKNTPTTTSNSTEVARPAATTPGRPRSLDDAMATAGTSVDMYVQVKEDGFILDKELKPKFETIKVSIVPDELKFGWGVRYQSGSGVQYAKSYDGVTETRSGKSWADFVSQAQKIDPKVTGQYDLVDIPMTLLEDLDRGAKGTLAAGARIGYTTSITGFNVFMAWLGQAIPNFGRDRPIPVEISIGTKRYPGGTYPVMQFKTLSE